MEQAERRSAKHGRQGSGGARMLLADRVYHVMHSRIANGSYAADQRLPSENELATELSVSRPVLRAALERLRSEGLIYSRQGAGSFVRPGDAQHGLGYSPVETIADIQRCYEFRLTIEPDAAYYAAQRRNQEMLDELSQVLTLLSDATSQHSHREDADYAFHMAITAAANNHYYEASMKALREHIHVGMRLHGRSLMNDRDTGLEHVFKEHAGIYEAIRDRDAEAARSRMRQHIESSRNRLFEDRLFDLSLK
ncbi:GntR family transcriptional regulator [Devosia sp. Root635]|nr:GntR family transcriptional regulator [Devosia sp. Root635]